MTVLQEVALLAAASPDTVWFCLSGPTVVSDTNQV